MLTTAVKTAGRRGACGRSALCIAYFADRTCRWLVVNNFVCRALAAHLLVVLVYYRAVKLGHRPGAAGLALFTYQVVATAGTVPPSARHSGIAFRTLFVLTTAVRTTGRRLRTELLALFVEFPATLIVLLALLLELFYALLAFLAALLDVGKAFFCETRLFSNQVVEFEFFRNQFGARARNGVGVLATEFHFLAFAAEGNLERVTGTNFLEVGARVVELLLANLGVRQAQRSHIIAHAFSELR